MKDKWGARVRSPESTSTWSSKCRLGRWHSWRIPQCWYMATFGSRSVRPASFGYSALGLVECLSSMHSQLRALVFPDRHPTVSTSMHSMGLEVN